MYELLLLLSKCQGASSTLGHVLVRGNIFPMSTTQKGSILVRTTAPVAGAQVIVYILHVQEEVVADDFHDSYLGRAEF